MPDRVNAPAGPTDRTLDVSGIQQALRSLELDAWLLYDFRGSNPLARRVLQIREGAGSRRFGYLVPAHGEPQKLVHRIESATLDHLPGSKRVYLKWQEFEAGMGWLVEGASRVAMEYSPRNANPYISRVDAGTVELVRSCGAEVVSSGDLVQLFEAVWSERQWQLHLEAAKVTDAAFDVAWTAIRQAAAQGKRIHETEVQQRILAHFHDHRLVTEHPPIVAVGPHSGDPHFEPGPSNDAAIGPGDFVLVDLWAKCDDPDGVYSDLTRVAFVGSEVPQAYQEVFRIVARARDAAIGAVEDAMAGNQPLEGWQVDRAARQVIEQSGYGPHFIHRTGHSIGRETHGNGANMDDLEMHDQRRVLPRTCFSIEPGIYLPEFGIRSEVNVFVDEQRRVHVTGGARQDEVLPLLRGAP